MSQQVRGTNRINSKRKRPHDSPTIAHPLSRKSRKLSDESLPAVDAESQEDGAVRSSNKHTKKERKQNRSTRIHSLKKQLARGTLPSTIQQEKERELAALIHEQTKTASKQQAKKTLEKYHYVRFLERRKAEKKLKRLRKQQETHGDSTELSNTIHEMEVNLNYTIYAPLGEKYVSLFVSENEVQPDDKRIKGEKLQHRPATWYAVESAMLHGEAELEALREGRNVSQAQTDLSNEEANLRHKQSPSKAGKDSNRDSSRIHTRKAQKVDSHLEVEGDASSDSDEIDGGFFER